MRLAVGRNADDRAFPFIGFGAGRGVFDRDVRVRVGFCGSWVVLYGSRREGELGEARKADKSRKRNSVE